MVKLAYVGVLTAQLACWKEIISEGWEDRSII
jgi:hypothetical protein